MSRFPIAEDEIVALATSLAGGLASDPIFANPPVTSTQMGAAETTFNQAASFSDQKKAEWLQSTEIKGQKLTILTGLMRNLLDWAVKIPGITEAQLKKIGWGFAAAPTELKAPAQCGNFRLHHIAGRVLTFDWDKPSFKDGGKPTGYKIYRRAAGTMGDWILEEAVFGGALTEDEESDFPVGTWDVVVAALNSKGEGPVSNTVTVTVG